MTRGGGETKLPITIDVPMFKTFVGEKVVKIIEKQKLGLGGYIFVFYCLIFSKSMAAKPKYYIQLQ